jgi:hypothetical protein
MLSFLMGLLYVLQFVVGGLLVVIGGLFLWAARNDAVQTWLEDVLSGLGYEVPEGQLFAKRRPFTFVVNWSRYAALAVGLAMLIPSHFMFDVVLGLIAVGLYYWMRRQRVLYDREISRDRRAA